MILEQALHAIRASPFIIFEEQNKPINYLQYSCLVLNSPFWDIALDELVKLLRIVKKGMERCQISNAFSSHCLVVLFAPSFEWSLPEEIQSSKIVSFVQSLFA